MGLEHRELDRVPIGLGGRVNSRIMALAYKGLRDALGLGPGMTRIADVYQLSCAIGSRSGSPERCVAPGFHPCSESAVPESPAAQLPTGAECEPGTARRLAHLFHWAGFAFTRLWDAPVGPGDQTWVGA
jgi:hypothetical protein